LQPYSLRNRPSRFSSYPFLQRQQQNWQQQHGTVKQCGQTVAAAVNKGGGGLVKKNTLGYGAGLVSFLPFLNVSFFKFCPLHSQSIFQTPIDAPQTQS